MKTKNVFQPFVWLMLFSGGALCQRDLISPIGSRSIAMGNTGYVLSDDESALFFNPAGLGFRNYRWNGGAITFFNEPRIEADAKSYYAITFQNDQIPKLGFAGYVNHLDEKVFINSTANPISSGEAHFAENTFAAGIGYRFYSNAWVDNSMGITLKYYDENRISIQLHTVAFDAGYLLQIIKQFRCGIVFRNIGPDLSYHFNNSTTTMKRLIPTTFASGIGYSNFINKGNLRVLDIATEFSFNSLTDEYQDTSHINSGAEIGLFKTFFFRGGFSRNLTNTVNQISWGTGLSILNHFEFDFYSYSYYYKNKFYSHYPGFSLSFKRGLNWQAKDRKWWVE
jgi:hypothetical protein